MLFVLNPQKTNNSISVPAPATSFRNTFFAIMLIISISRKRNAIRIPVKSKLGSLLLPVHKVSLTADTFFYDIKIHPVILFDIIVHHNIFYGIICYSTLFNFIISCFIIYIL